MNEYVIETRNLTKQYGVQKSVSDLNIHVKRGRIYGLLGRNGAGKTTTMKMLLGLIKPTSGTVKIFGKSMIGNEKKILPRIGCLIESPGFYPNLTGTENLKIFVRLRGIPAKNAIKSALEVVGLPYNDKKLFSQYSLGMKQRLAIALAIMHDPELLILDEPINGLDPIGIAEVRDFIRELCDVRGKTILISSHILSEISLLADDIGIIDHGVLLEEESIAELEQKNSKYIHFVVSDAAQASRIIEKDFNTRNFAVENDHSLRIYDTDLSVSAINRSFIESRIVFVGDKDQLESVGPGNVFKELIDSRVIPVTVLDQCFRQENPTILENAIKINCGKQNLVYDNSFSFVAAHDDEEAAKKIMKLFDMEWKLQRKNVNAVQVLTPLREDTKVSANALNLKIKDRINPHQIGQQEIKNGNKIFRIQDKVMQTKNEDEISNGDIGIVRKIGKVSGKKYMEVDFGEERVMRYQEGESWNLVHAYAITAHKGQGSEYPVVIIPILSCFRRHTLKRNLYYTAITRAKRKVILVGSKQAFSQAIRAGRSKKRNTLLSYRLKKAFTEVLDKNEAA